MGGWASLFSGLSKRIPNSVTQRAVAAYFTGETSSFRWRVPQIDLWNIHECMIRIAQQNVHSISRKSAGHAIWCMILLSCKFSNFVASRTFMANGLDCRQCTIGRLEPILCRFHNCLNHFKATRLVLVLISPHFSRGLVKSWVARIS